MANPSNRNKSRRANTAVVAGSAVTGIAGMAFIVLTERSMNTVDFEAVAQLWTIWSIAGAVATFAVQQWIISARRTGFVPLAQLFNLRLLAAAGSMSAAVFAFTAAFRTDLFASTGFGWPAAAACIPLGSVAIGLARGLWATENRFAGLGVIIALENLLRLSAAAVLAIVGASSGWFAGALLLGFAAATVVPRGNHQEQRTTSALPSTNLLLATAAAGFFSHAAINGGPLILAIVGAPNAPVAELFVVLALARLPLLLAVHGLLPIFSVKVNSMVVANDHRGLAETRRLFGLVGPVAAATLGTIGAFIGPPVVRLIFDTENRLERWDYGLAIALTLLAGASLTANTALVAEGRIRYQMLAWGLPVSLGIGFLVLVGEPTARTILCTFLLVEVCILALVTHVASVTGRTANHEPVEERSVTGPGPRPGSADE